MKKRCPWLPILSLNCFYQENFELEADLEEAWQTVKLSVDMHGWNLSSLNLVEGSMTAVSTTMRNRYPAPMARVLEPLLSRNVPNAVVHACT